MNSNTSVSFKMQTHRPGEKYLSQVNDLGLRSLVNTLPSAQPWNFEVQFFLSILLEGPSGLKLTL